MDTPQVNQANDAKGEIPGYSWIFRDLEMSCDPVEAINFRDMIEVSDMLMAGYARFVRQGMPCELVGFAMLGATMNLYEVFDMRANLPQILRRLADCIEQEKDH